MRKIGFYIGTYTGHGSEGIYFCQLDSATGELSAPVLAGKTDNPSFLALHPNGTFLYAANEEGPDAKCEPGVSAFAISNQTHALEPINRQPSHGSAPCHVSIDPTGTVLLVANYASGTFAAFALQPDGAISPATAVHQDTGEGPVADRQDGPHAHGIWPMPGRPATRQLIGCDLGTDELWLFNLDPAAARFAPADPPAFAMPPGTGPRHIAFSHDRRFLYVIAELANTISVLDVTGREFRLIQEISTLPPHHVGQVKAAEVALHPAADILYATNRGADDLVTYAIDPATGKLRELARHPIDGKDPRHFAVDPGGRWLLAANETSNSIVTFRLDEATHLPRQVGPALPISAPVCILFDK